MGKTKRTMSAIDEDQKQTPTPVPETVGSQEPDEGSAEPATDSIAENNPMEMAKTDTCSAVKRILNAPVALAQMKQVLESGVV